MDSRLDSVNFDSNEQRKQRIEVADKLMSILDEDGQPMFNESWIRQHIIGEFEETKNPE
jgi:hypothetical protein